MSARVSISVIIRARDEAASIGRCLELVAGQRVEPGTVETIVVDNGSRDRTAAIARSAGAQVLDIDRNSFTFGRALNLGAANAEGELLVALSGHAFPPDQDWLARLADALSDSRVACACGDRRGPSGQPLERLIEQDAALAGQHPEWGYSNGAGIFRADLWRQRPFREDLAGCEDKEWAWYWVRHGLTCLIDPNLAVEHDHEHDSLAATYARARREAAGLRGFLELPPYGRPALVREWWSEQGWHRSRLRARTSPRRMARLLGKYAGYH